MPYSPCSMNLHVYYKLQMYRLNDLKVALKQRTFSNEMVSLLLSLKSMEYHS